MNNMFNPMQLMVNQMMASPLFRQAQEMARGKTPEELRKTCENICRQKGIDLNAAFNQFQAQFSGLK